MRVDAWQPALLRGVRLELDSGGVVVRVRAGAERLTQVLDNLIANAVRAAPDGSAVTVVVRETSAGHELAVRDHGPGLTAEQKVRAFDRFWRAGSGGEGSGLGLAITRRLVELDGGTIELRDAPGEGLEAVVTYRRLIRRRGRCWTGASALRVGVAVVSAKVRTAASYTGSR